VQSSSWGFIQQRHKEHLSSWALPSDLYTYQRQLKALHITGPITHPRWLKAELTTLAMTQSALQDLTTLPPTLTELRIWGDTGITSLAGLEKLPQLITLELRGTGITSIKMLSSSQSLQTLYLPKKVYSLDGLPTSVNRLVLE
jgi:Leucine-rich repeat (LRR) protein